jgi:hypothetical protein
MSRRLDERDPAPRPYSGGAGSNGHALPNYQPVAEYRLSIVLSADIGRNLERRAREQETTPQRLATELLQICYGDPISGARNPIG